MELKYFLSLFFLSCIGCTSIKAQNSDDPKIPVTITAGAEFRALIPISFFTMDSVVLRDPTGAFNAVYSYTGGFGFGGAVRIKLSNFWNIETGLYYTRRGYDLTVRDPSLDFNESASFRIVGYEIPVKGLVYIRMGEQIYMNVALGVSADFFASDVMYVAQDYNIQAFKRNWIRAAVLGAVGVEYRTEENGSFYLGGGIHQPFGDIYITQVNYRKNGIPPSYFQVGLIDGTYFSVDFKYFLPVKADTKPKVKYVKPDWKNM